MNMYFAGKYTTAFVIVFLLCLPFSVNAWTSIRSSPVSLNFTFDGDSLTLNVHPDDIERKGFQAIKKFSCFSYYYRDYKNNHGELSVLYVFRRFEGKDERSMPLGFIAYPHSNGVGGKVDLVKRVVLEDTTVLTIAKEQMLKDTFLFPTCFKKDYNILDSGVIFIVIKGIRLSDYYCRSDDSQYLDMGQH